MCVPFHHDKPKNTSAASSHGSGAGGASRKLPRARRFVGSLQGAGGAKPAPSESNCRGRLARDASAPEEIFIFMGGFGGDLVARRLTGRR